MCAIVGFGASLPPLFSVFPKALYMWLTSFLSDFVMSTTPPKYAALFLASIHFNVYVKSTAK